MICTHTKQKNIKMHTDLMRTLKENGRSMKNFIFLKATTKIEESSTIQIIKIGNKVISIFSIK